MPPQAPLLPPATGEILKLLQNLMDTLQPRTAENMSMPIVISQEPPMPALRSQSPLPTVTGTISVGPSPGGGATSTSSRPLDETAAAGQRNTSTVKYR